jgi:hypothetical protein
MKLYKVLNADLKSPFQSFQFELNKKYTCTDFDTNPKNECSRGFYATGIDGLIYSFRPNKIVAECEVSGKQVECDQFKRRYEHIELLRVLSTEGIKALATAEESKVGYKLCEAMYPVNPLLLPAKREILTAEIERLKEWDSVRGSVRGSVWDSVGGSVRGSVWGSVWGSVRGSVWGSVWGSVRGSVWGSVWAYTSSLFPGITKWKHIDHTPGTNPFRSAVDLWHMGLVASFDGTTWRLHTGEKAEIVYEWRK